MFNSPFHNAVLAAVDAAIAEVETAFDAEAIRLEQVHQEALDASMKAHVKMVIQKVLSA